MPEWRTQSNQAAIAEGQCQCRRQAWQTSGPAGGEIAATGHNFPRRTHSGDRENAGHARAIAGNPTGREQDAITVSMPATAYGPERLSNTPGAAGAV